MPKGKSSSFNLFPGMGNKKILPIPEQVKDFLANNKGGKVEAHYDSNLSTWVYSFLKKGEKHMPPDDDMKCIECKKQGLVNASIGTNAHCIECMHCYDHCISLHMDCLCCCVDPHCAECLWHDSSDACDLFSCSCCCNDHCVQCGHENPEQCKDDGYKCSCCGCNSSSKLNPLQATNVNGEWLDILKGDHNSKINPKHLGPTEILKDIGKFYILFAHGDKKMLDAHKKKLAQYMLNYLMVSCAGEARHTLSKTHGDITKLGQMAQTILCAKDANSSLLNRQYMWSAMYDLAQVSGYEVILEALEELFNLNWITGSYGGSKWAKIAELAKNYTKGDYTEAIFIDGIMNVVHNGGWAFNKYYKSQVGSNYYNKGITMMTMLDYKKEATKESIYALLVPLNIPNSGDNISLWKKALELGVVNEHGELTAKYGVAFEKEKKQAFTSEYYKTTVKVDVPSQAYINYITVKEVLVEQKA